jgi:hypothetical protein
MVSMEQRRIPKPGELYRHFKGKLYQILTVATHTETGERMVVCQALYGDFKTYVRPLEMFLSEVDTIKYPDIRQKYRFELREEENINCETMSATIIDTTDSTTEIEDQNKSDKSIDSANIDIVNREGNVNTLLLKFLDAETYNKKLEVVSSNIKHLNDRLINDMAVALDCAIEEGTLDERIQGLIHCLQAMCRFEDRRFR